MDSNYAAGAARVLIGSVRGRSHERRQAPNQDAAAVGYGAADTVLTNAVSERWGGCVLVSLFVVAIADGHGADAHPHSDVGARLAVETAVEVLSAVAAEAGTVTDLEKMLRFGREVFVREWCLRVKEDMMQRSSASELPGMHPAAKWVTISAMNLQPQEGLEHWEVPSNASVAPPPIVGAGGKAEPPLTLEANHLAPPADVTVRVAGHKLPPRPAAVSRDEFKPYGTTVLAVVVTPVGIGVLQLGDGGMVALGRGGDGCRVFSVGDGYLANETDSLGSPDAPERMRTRVLADDLEYLLLSTDGFEGAYPQEDSFVAVADSQRDYFRNGQADEVLESLPEWLRQVSNDATGDDATAALVYFPAPVSQALRSTPPSESTHSSLRPRRDAFWSLFSEILGRHRRENH